MSRLRVLHVISGLETGGAETSLTRLVAATSRDVCHTIVSLTGRGTQAVLLEQHGATVHALRWKRGRISLSGLRAIVRLVSSTNADVIHGWMYHANLIATLVAVVTNRRKRLVWSIRHSLDGWLHESRALRLVIRAGALVSRLPQQILYNSERARAQHEQLGYHAGRSMVVPNGFDTERFAPDAARRARIRTSLGIAGDAPVVGMVARVHPLKDHGTFLQAAALLRRQLPNARFVLAGRGTNDSQGIVRRTVRELGLDDAVLLLGDRSDAEAVYNACDLVALTSTSEAFPNTVGEAMSSGVPCVVTDVGDARRIAGGIGRVIAPGDAAACARAWGDVLARPKLSRAALGIAARGHIVSHFSVARSRDSHLALWSALSGRAVARTPRRVLHVLTASMSLHFLRGQRECLEQQGIDLHVACTPGAELDEWAARYPGTAHAIPMRRAIAPVADLVALWRLVRLMREQQFHVVHAGTPKGGMLGSIAARISRVPTRIYHLRGLPLSTATGFKRHVLRFTERLSIAAATHVLSVSDSLRREAASHGLVDPANVLLIGAGSSNGVDARARFNPSLVSRRLANDVRSAHGISTDAIVIGFVGRITRDKGIAELLDAWRSVRSAHGNVHLLVVGDADDATPQTAHVLAAFRGDPRVHVHGGDWNTPPLYAAMDLLVLPTYREGFPNVLLEAAAMALPVVATRVPGCVDAVDDTQTGMLVPPRDGAALASAVARYVTNPELRRVHGNAARSRILRDFDQQLIWDGLASLYGSATTPPPSDRDGRETQSQEQAA